MPSNFRNRAISPTEVHGHKCSALAQKRGFACAVIYLEYPHIYRHLLLSEIDYKHSLFGRFQIKKSIGRYLPMDSYFYVECPKNGMLITAFVSAKMRNKSIRQKNTLPQTALQPLIINSDSRHWLPTKVRSSHNVPRLFLYRTGAARPRRRKLVI